jgi:rhamnosyltransferase
VTLSASVIVRTYDSAATIRAAIASVREQSISAQVVVVDSGSTDGTRELAAELADTVVDLPHEEFTFGRSLNVGAAASTGDLVAALSSHCAYPRRDWLAIAARHIEAGAAAACGQYSDGDRGVLIGPFRAELPYLREHPLWGMSNHAAAWKGALVRAVAFDETLSASEDKEWCWRAVGDGWIVIDPALVVEGGHRRAHGTRDYYRRLVKEYGSLRHLEPTAPYPLTSALRDFAAPVPVAAHLSDAPRLRRTRAIEVAAQWRATRPTRLRDVGTGH